MRYRSWWFILGNHGREEKTHVLIPDRVLRVDGRLAYSFHDLPAVSYGLCRSFLVTNGYVGRLVDNKHDRSDDIQNSP